MSCIVYDHYSVGQTVYVVVFVFSDLPYVSSADDMVSADYRFEVRPLEVVAVHSGYVTVPNPVGDGRLLAVPNFKAHRTLAAAQAEMREMVGGMGVIE